MKRFAFILLAFSLVSTSCRYIGGKRVRGNGHITTETRTVGEFNSVRAGGAYNVYVTQDSQFSVKVEADENLMEYIDIYTEGDDLFIENKYGYNPRPSRKLKVYVSAPAYRRISVSGAGDIVGQNQISNHDQLELRVSGAGNVKMDVDAPRVEVHVSGSGDIALKGKAKDFDASVSGAGNIKCYDMMAEKTDVQISGAGDAEVFASVQLDARVSGAGNVKYKGDPPTVNSKTSGAGSIHKVN